VCLGDPPDQARERFARSAFDLFRRSLQKTMTKGVDLEAYLEANLVGTPDAVCEKVAAFERAGLEPFCATLFVGTRSPSCWIRCVTSRAT